MAIQMTSDDKQAGLTEQDAGGVTPDSQHPAAQVGHAPADIADEGVVPADAVPENAVPDTDVTDTDVTDTDVTDNASAETAPPQSAASAEEKPLEAVNAEALPGPLPGELLATRRRQLTFSIDEVATRVRLAPRQIAALEANDFGALPGMATVRGFIRSYAKLLGLDPEPLVAMLANEPNPAFEPMVVRRPLPSSGFRSRKYAPPVLHRRGARKLAGVAAVVLVFVGTLAFVAYRNNWLHLPSMSATDKPAGEILTPAMPPAPPAADEQSSAGAPQAAGALELKAREDSWVEVVAVSGERKLLSKLMKAGSTELVEVSEPVVLLVGNASGVDAILRGEALNLKAAARDNVVKLSLN